MQGNTWLFGIQSISSWSEVCQRVERQDSKSLFGYFDFSYSSDGIYVIAQQRTASQCSSNHCLDLFSDSFEELRVCLSSGIDHLTTRSNNIAHSFVINPDEGSKNRDHAHRHVKYSWDVDWIEGWYCSIKRFFLSTSNWQVSTDRILNRMWRNAMFRTVFRWLLRVRNVSKESRERTVNRSRSSALQVSS